MARDLSPTDPLWSALALHHPYPIAVFDSYPQAQTAVDYLSDCGFPVNKLAIVGNDLRMVERVVGRRSYATAAWRGASSGFTFGILISVVMLLAFPQLTAINALLYGIMSGIFLGILINMVKYLLSRGQRDFESMTRILPTQFEVFAEAQVAEQAKNLLAKADQLAKEMSPSPATTPDGHSGSDAESVERSGLGGDDSDSKQ